MARDIPDTAVASAHGRPVAGPHVICRSGRHCAALTGMTYDGRCLPCRRESHNRANDRWRNTAKGTLTNMKHDANRRGVRTR